MPTAAILPVKSFARAKQRLGATLADPLRPMLAEAMVDDVLAALESTRAIARTIVVTREPVVIAKAEACGAIVLTEQGEHGQSAAAALGIARALREGFERVLCVPGDCPALDPAELDGMLSPEQPSGPGVVILPDRHGSGTNGLLLSPPGAIEPSFGPDSCERHLALAREAGVSCTVRRLASLLLDIDTGADLAALRARLEEPGSERAQRTRAVLARPEFTRPGAIAAPA